MNLLLWPLKELYQQSAAIWAKGQRNGQNMAYLGVFLLMTVVLSGLLWGQGIRTVGPYMLAVYVLGGLNFQSSNLDFFQKSAILGFFWALPGALVALFLPASLSILGLAFSGLWAGNILSWLVMVFIISLGIGAGSRS